jgi:hypothetical protein
MPGGICTDLITADAASTAQYQSMQSNTNYIRNNINTLLVLIVKQNAT